MYCITNKKIREGESEYTEHYLVIAKSVDEAWVKSWEHLRSEADEERDEIDGENLSISFNGDSRIVTIHSVHQVSSIADLEKILYTIR